MRHIIRSSSTTADEQVTYTFQGRYASNSDARLHESRNPLRVGHYPRPIFGRSAQLAYAQDGRIHPSTPRIRYDLVQYQRPVTSSTYRTCTSPLP